MNVYPQAYLDYLIFFQAERDYFECHEVMEAYWKEHPGDPQSSAFVGLIQLAVGLYHQRRGNLAGAVKMLQSSWNHLSEEHIEALGMDLKTLNDRIAERIEALKSGTPAYEDIELPIQDPKLLEQCQRECQRLGLLWSGPSDINNKHLIHKHTLRDRSELIEQRKEQIRKRQQQKGVSS
jgi:predicted metal-dependent hydrolase